MDIYFIYIATLLDLCVSNPENLDRVLFKDKADNCFSFTSEEVECPSDETKIRSYNIQ